MGLRATWRSLKDLASRLVVGITWGNGSYRCYKYMRYVPLTIQVGFRVCRVFVLRILVLEHSGLGINKVLSVLAFVEMGTPVGSLRVCWDCRELQVSL